MSGVRRSISRACRPFSARRTDHLPALQLAGQGEDVAQVVVDDQDLLAGQLRVGLLALVEHLPGRRPEVGLDPVEEQRRLVDEVLQRPDVLDDRRLGHLVEPGLLLGGQVPAGVDDDPEVLAG